MSFRIERLYAFISTDNPGGDEGLVAINRHGQWLPFVAADTGRVEQLRALARDLARETGRSMQVAIFERRVDLEVIGPGGSKPS